MSSMPVSGKTARGIALLAGQSGEHATLVWLLGTVGLVGVHQLIFFPRVAQQLAELHNHCAMLGV